MFLGCDASGPIYPNGNNDNLDPEITYTETFPSGFIVEFTGFTTLRSNGYEITGAAPTNPTAVVIDLIPNEEYFYDIYVEESALNYVFVNNDNVGLLELDDNQEPNVRGYTRADKSGKITFTFQIGLEANVLRVSGMTIGRLPRCLGNNVRHIIKISHILIIRGGEAK